MSRPVTQLYPSPDQLRARVEQAVSAAIAVELRDTGLARFRQSHLQGAMEGLVDVATNLCLSWASDPAGALALAQDMADVLTGQVAANAVREREPGND